jgi:hypothetical protein
VPKQGIAASLLTVVAAVVAADLIREDSGFVAATTMGIVLANQRQLDVSKVLEFQGTVVELLIGILFVLISASVTPSSVGPLLPAGLGLIAVMMLIIRPLVIALGTWGSAATPSAFGPALASAGVSGANKILPVAFIAIFGTVAIYGLTATALARGLGVAGTGAIVVLVVGGHRWAQSIAAALKDAGVGVRLWTGQPAEQTAAREAGLDARNARLGVDRTVREAELEDVTDALLLTASDNFNALAAFELRQELGHDHVYRLTPESELLDLVPAHAEGRALFDMSLTFTELSRRFGAGAQVIRIPADHPSRPEGPGDQKGTLLFGVSPTGELAVATAGTRLQRAAGHTTIWLTPESSGGPTESTPGKPMGVSWQRAGADHTP